MMRGLLTTGTVFDVSGAARSTGARGAFATFLLRAFGSGRMVAAVDIVGSSCWRRIKEEQFHGMSSGGCRDRAGPELNDRHRQ